MKKLTPVKIKSDSDLAKQLGTQEISRSMPLSRDPVKYPVFRVPTNKKVLIYVPNHTVLNKDGEEELRMDKPYIHAVSVRKNSWEYYRCTSGLVDNELGFDGTCPLCDGSSEPWDLAKYQIEDKCRAQGLNPDDKENETVKGIRQQAFSARVLNDAEQYVTFPIVVFETVNDDGKTPVMSDDGKNVVFKIMWYSIRKSTYDEKWGSCLENMEDEPSHPGGLFFTLDFTYTPKSGDPNARDSARNLKVYNKTVKDSEKLRAALDKATEDWTPAVAQQMVIRNNIYTVEDLKSVADEVLETTRNLIALYESKSVTGSGIEKNEMAGMIGKKKEENDGEIPIVMDETDED